MNKKENLYIEYKLLGLLDSKSLYKQKHSDYISGTIIKHFKYKFSFTEDEFDSLSEKYSDIPFIKNKFNEKRRKDFNNDVIKFYNWFKKQKNCCGYCGITQEELHNIFTNDENKILPLNDNWSKNDKGTLQIERLDSKTNSYNENNIILACPLCNNAKSNLIDEDSWRDLFVIPMRKYYEKLLNKELINPIPN